MPCYNFSRTTMMCPFTFNIKTGFGELFYADCCIKESCQIWDASRNDCGSKVK
jgi:hypothetical protein